MWKIKKGSECVTKTFRIPVEICSTMETLATKNNISLNSLLVQSLEYALANLQQEEATASESCHSRAAQRKNRD